MAKPFNIKTKYITKTRVNLWNNTRILNSQKLKWKFFKRSQDKSRVFGNFYSRGNKQIRFLFNNLLKFEQILRINKGKIKKRQFKDSYKKLQYKPSRLLYFINGLEKRLDVFLYRTGIFKNIFELRQIISHSNVLVNGKIVKVSSYVLKPNDLIEITNSRVIFKNIRSSRFINKPLNESFEFNYNILKGVYIKPFSYKNLPYYFGKK
jgi:ribosomal protein S4